MPPFPLGLSPHSLPPPLSSYAVVVIASVVTVILFSLPPEEEEDSSSSTLSLSKAEEFDYSIPWRLALVVLVGISALIGLVLCLLDVALQPRIATIK